MGGSVFIAESVFTEDNPWDGRTRHGVCTSLEAALDALRNVFGKEKVTTERSTGWLPAGVLRCWAVHDPDTEASDEGVLWIFEEELRA